MNTELSEQARIRLALETAISMLRDIEDGETFTPDKWYRRIFELERTLKPNLDDCQLLRCYEARALSAQI